jgi:hypothetical protein
MSMPWDVPPEPVRAPWDVPPKPVRPELVKDPATGLYPGQLDADDIPGFLKRVRKEDQSFK